MGALEKISRNSYSRFNCYAFSRGNLLEIKRYMKSMTYGGEQRELVLQMIGYFEHVMENLR